MLKRPLLILTLALVLAIGFAVGIGHLFTLRYEAGEVYPTYSTLRADPVGTKAIYDALRELPGFEVRRNFHPLKMLQPGRPITLVYAGVQRQSYWTEREFQELETLLSNGSRVVFAFFPIDFAPPPEEQRREAEEERHRKREQIEREEETSPEGERKNDGKASSAEREKEGMLSFEKVAERFGFRFEYQPLTGGKTYDRHAFLFAPRAALETDVSWHSALHFSDLAPAWQALYLSETKALVAERSYGRGTIIISSDSFFLSNEALRRERHPLLLARIFAGPPLVIFDEEHLGVREEPGIVSLVKKYRLEGVVLGLVLVAALFVWKNVTPFLPPRTEGGDEGDLVLGKESAQGFTNLLRRSIKRTDLLRVCLEEWRRSSTLPAQKMGIVEELWAQEQSRPAKQRNPASTYRAIAQALARR